jgi:DNA-directed RNA polymerase specialized sigma24 family protein
MLKKKRHRCTQFAAHGLYRNRLPATARHAGSRAVTSTFPATRWSIIAAAASGGDRPAARTALDELCRIYWFPLYAFARRKGLSPEDAEDATQNFLLEVLESNLFTDADPSLGRLRTFLLAAFSRCLSNARRHAARHKRGGHIEFVALGFEGAEERYMAASCGSDTTPQFDTDWAIALLEGAVARIEAEYAASNRAEIFKALRPFLGTTSEPRPNQADLAESLGMSHVALRQSLYRLRDRFRAILRSQIADTLRNPTEAAIDEELRSLRIILASAA